MTSSFSLHVDPYELARKLSPCQHLCNLLHRKQHVDKVHFYDSVVKAMLTWAGVLSQATRPDDIASTFSFSYLSLLIAGGQDTGVIGIAFAMKVWEEAGTGDREGMWGNCSSHLLTFSHKVIAIHVIGDGGGQRIGCSVVFYIVNITGGIKLIGNGGVCRGTYYLIFNKLLIVLKR